MLDDETLRDGLQSPSVCTPTIDEKIDILRRMDALGIETADIGLPECRAVQTLPDNISRAKGLLSLHSCRRPQTLCRHGYRLYRRNSAGNGF